MPAERSGFEGMRFCPIPYSRSFSVRVAGSSQRTSRRAERRGLMREEIVQAKIARPVRMMTVASRGAMDCAAYPALPFASCPRVICAAMRRDHLVVLLAAGSIACGSSSPPPAVNTVVITATALELPIGGTLQLVANAFDASGILIPGTKAAWTSSDPRVATISDVGVLSGVAFGDTNVTATVNGVTGTQPFTVAGIQSGAGTATVDGAMAAGEWSRASILDIAAVNLPGGTTPGKLYVMNDGTDLYLALTFSRTAPAGETSDLSFEFDNDASGTLNAGDDGVMLSDKVFHDLVTAAPCPAGGPACEVLDTDLMNGTNDGAGAFVN